MNNPLTRDNNKDYEHIRVNQSKLQEKGIRGSVRESGWSFSSVELYIKQPKSQKGLQETEILGLRCPDCQHCAHSTDVPNVATCCNPIGWFFFYRRLDQDVSSKTKLVIKNGELVQDTGTDKAEASF